MNKDTTVIEILQTKSRTNRKASIYTSKFKMNAELLFMALPSILAFIVFCYLPMPWLFASFTSYDVANGLFGSKFIGLDNFKFLFTTDTAWRLIRNTVSYNLAFMILGNSFSIILALMFYELRSKWAMKLYTTLMIFPKFLSWVIIAFMFYGFMSPDYGIINNLIKSIGFESVNWYVTPGAWPFIFPIVSIWASAGMGAVVYYAALAGIDKEYFEAAALDGATKWQSMRYISLPAISSLVILFLILGIGHIIKGDFGMFFYLSKDSALIYPTTDILDTYIYRVMRTLNDIGMSTAASFFQSIVGLILVLISNTIIRKINPESALF